MTPTRTQVQLILKQHGLRPLKQLGQHFLVDPNLARFIVEQLPAGEGDAVLEIGPGLGALTHLLLQKKNRLTAIEMDRGICVYLEKTFAQQPNFQLIPGDALEHLPQLFAFPYIIGNLPYNISTPLLIQILQLDPLPQICLFTLQKEITQRLAAKPKTKSYGAVTVFLQHCYQIQTLKMLPSQVFFPPPNVDSALVRLTRLEALPPNLQTAAQRADFYQFLRRAFSQRRKMLKKIIPALDTTARAEEIDPSQWLELYGQCRRTL